MKDFFNLIASCVIVGILLSIATHIYMGNKFDPQITALENDIEKVSIELRKVKEALGIKNGDCNYWLNGYCAGYLYVVPSINEIQIQIYMLASELGYVYKDLKEEMIPAHWEKSQKLTASHGIPIDEDGGIYLDCTYLEAVKRIGGN